MEQDQELQKWQESFCANAGLFGVLLSVTCLLQQLFFFSSHWIVFTAMACIYGLCVVSFVLLIKKAPSAPLLLLVSGILIFLLEVFMMYSLAYSLALVLLMLYLCAVCTVLFVDGIPSLLKKRYALIKEEADKWEGVL